ncbi:hypothetical protein [Actinomadura sp. WMMB 499]|uniref:hypothetical protein n=1 Tax=Actinomadura sp. WMMB 499 TaxID=1219491 RepID=UPI0012460B62|nr:hypothetical protein [Actinomadura sp. WMMB 499]QFG23336.1 hypothetical protein F7P10_21655 [Actinomadura sp. WMMB 499]
MVERDGAVPRRAAVPGVPDAQGGADGQFVAEPDRQPVRRTGRRAAAQPVRQQAEQHAARRPVKPVEYLDKSVALPFRHIPDEGRGVFIDNGFGRAFLLRSRGGGDRAQPGHRHGRHGTARSGPRDPPVPLLPAPSHLRPPDHGMSRSAITAR